MHELGVVFHIADSVVKIAEENQASHIRSWNCKRVPMLEGCELTVEEIPAVTYCTACGKTYPTVPQGKICPYCGSEETYLQQGNEVEIKEIAVE